jgi:chaperone required for assembly of F1-ATPase
MKPPQPTRKRFYKSATVAEEEAGAYSIQLDGRRVKTPAGKALTVPTRGLADAIAAEWNAQGETISPARLPLTKLANTAIDAVPDRKAEVVDEIVKFAASDLVCYRASYPAELVAAQARAWDPILIWMKATYRAAFLTASGIAHVAQPAGSLEAVRGVVASFDAFKLAALHVMTTLTGSALIALAHVGGDLDTATAWAAAHVDENWQASRWGEDLDAAQRQKAMLAEFESASRVFKLSDPAGLGSLKRP